MRPRSFRAAGVVTGVVVCLVAGGTALAQSFPRYLQQVRLTAAQNAEVIEFHFSQPYQGQPIVKYRPGVVALNFSATGSKTPGRTQKVTDSRVIRDYKVVQNRSSTTVTFNLKQRGDTLQGRLEFVSKGKILNVVVPLAPLPAAAAAEKGGVPQSLQREMNARVLGTSDSGAASAAPKAAQPLGGYNDSELLTPLLTMLVALAVVILVLYLVMLFYNRYFARRLRRFGGGYAVKMLASFHIGPRQRVVVLDINGAVMACGVTPSQITMLTRLNANTGAGGAAPGRAKRPATSAARGAGAAEGQVAAAAADALPADKGGAQEQPPARTDPVSQFAETLKEKVRSLKRIH